MIGWNMSIHVASQGVRRMSSDTAVSYYPAAGSVAAVGSWPRNVRQVYCWAYVQDDPLQHTIAA